METGLKITLVICGTVLGLAAISAIAGNNLAKKMSAALDKVQKPIEYQED